MHAYTYLRFYVYNGMISDMIRFESSRVGVESTDSMNESKVKYSYSVAALWNAGMELCSAPVAIDERFALDACRYIYKDKDFNGKERKGKRRSQSAPYEMEKTE